MTTQAKSTAKSAASTGKTTRMATPKPPAKKKTKTRIATGVPNPPMRSTAAVQGDTVTSEAVDTGADSTLKKQELLALVVERSDIKKKFAKPVVEAMLEVLGEALSDGREFNLQPLGRLKHNRTKETPNARIVIAKIRQRKGPAAGSAPPKDPIADAAE